MRSLPALLLAILFTASAAWAADKAKIETNPDALKRALDRAATVDEKPCAPADGAVLSVNPPAFVWMPVAKKPSPYLLAISQNADFSAATETIEVPISIYVPKQTMTPGAWHWRVGLRLPQGAMVWSRSRAFRIDANAKAWPLPDVEKLVAQVPQQHPRLFFSGERLEQARRQTKADMAREFADLCRQANKAVGQPLIAEPPRLPEKQPDRGREYARVIRETRPPMDQMEACALAYLLGGDRRFGEEAKRRLLHFFAWDPDGTTSLFYNDEPAMWVMQRGSRAYDWTYDLFTPAERAKIEPVMQARYRQFLKRLTGMPFESRPYSSHPARDLGFLGEGAILFLHEWPESKQWLHYILSIYWSVYPAWAKDDGGWQEGPSYWGAYMSFAMHFAAALKLTSGADLMQKPFFRNTPYYKLYTNPPYAQHSPYGDGQSNPAGATDLMDHFGVLLDDAHIRWYAAARRAGPGNGVLGFALSDITPRPQPPVDLPQARAFPGAGLVAMHADLADPRRNAYLVLRSSPFGSVSHGHADQNAFAIEAFGEALAIASGHYPWYGSPHHDQWTRQTKAVNSVTIDGVGQKSRSYDAHGSIERFVTGEAFDYALADATPAYAGALTKFHRHVLHVRPGIFVVIDELAAPKPGTFQWWLHSMDQMQIDAERNEVHIRRRDAHLSATFLTPAKLDFQQTGKFDPPPEREAPDQWRLTASTKTKAAAEQFFVVLAPYSPKGPADVRHAAPALRPLGEGITQGAGWSEGNFTYEVFFNPDGVRTTAVRSDARLVALRREAGKPTAWLATGCGKLAIDGKSVWQCDAARDVTWSSDAQGGRLTTTGPAAKARAEGIASPLELPAGEFVRDIATVALSDAPRLTFSFGGNEQQLVGRRYDRTHAQWEVPYAGSAGRFRMTLPAGVRCFVDALPVGDEPFEVRAGQIIRWYGPAADQTVKMTSATTKK